jgi:hypothetical protein
MTLGMLNVSTVWDRRGENGKGLKRWEESFVEAFGTIYGGLYRLVRHPMLW